GHWQPIERRMAKEVSACTGCDRKPSVRSIGGVPDERSSEPDRRATKTDAHPPMQRDKRGWHVAPAPDGRGTPEHTPSGPPAHRRRGFLWFVLALIALNWLTLLVFQPSTGQPRVTVSFNPYFLEQVNAGEVKSISSKGNTIQGTFKTKQRYPRGDK